MDVVDVDEGNKQKKIKFKIRRRESINLIDI